MSRLVFTIVAGWIGGRPYGELAPDAVPGSLYGTAASGGRDAEAGPRDECGQTAGGDAAEAVQEIGPA